ncbi:MAG: V-type ATPase subunit [Synergistaceae bacterium]|jgi:V/A-type H+-transporting ATPase subunit C|nr:V-type ATPase subunit [Synergistaceae bacterium]
MSRSEDYGYAVARIRAMERLLLDAGQFQRLLEADDLSGALKILGETSYGISLSEGDAEERYDVALEAELISTCKELRTFVPDALLVDICRIQYDFHNVKVLLKSSFNSKSGGKKRWDLMTALGTISADELIVNIESEDYKLLPWGFPSLIPACLSQWEQTRDIVEVERLLDLGMFAAMLRSARELGEPGVTKWVRARIDSENIRNLLRLKRFGVDSARALSFLHPGGSVAPATLIQVMAEPFDSWARAISHSDVGCAIAGVQDDSDFDNLIVALEKALDDYCRDVTANARYSRSAPENVIAYLWGKEMEIKNIRTILVSKGGGGDREGTRRMLRHGY